VILPSLFALHAVALLVQARSALSTHADSVSLLEMLHGRSGLHHATDDLVSNDHRVALTNTTSNTQDVSGEAKRKAAHAVDSSLLSDRRSPATVDSVDIASADTAVRDLNLDPIVGQLRRIVGERLDILLLALQGDSKRQTEQESDRMSEEESQRQQQSESGRRKKRRERDRCVARLDERTTNLCPTRLLLRWAVLLLCCLTKAASPLNTTLLSLACQV